MHSGRKPAVSGAMKAQYCPAAVYEPVFFLAAQED
jgi:hypothetical protein